MLGPGSDQKKFVKFGFLFSVNWNKTAALFFSQSVDANCDWRTTYWSHERENHITLIIGNISWSENKVGCYFQNHHLEFETLALLDQFREVMIFVIWGQHVDDIKRRKPYLLPWLEIYPGRKLLLQDRLREVPRPLSVPFQIRTSGNSQPAPSLAWKFPKVPNLKIL